MLDNPSPAQALTARRRHVVNRREGGASPAFDGAGDR
jgi:hypothetical protein